MSQPYDWRRGRRERLILKVEEEVVKGEGGGGLVGRLSESVVVGDVICMFGGSFVLFCIFYSIEFVFRVLKLCATFWFSCVCCYVFFFSSFFCLTVYLM